VQDNNATVLSKNRKRKFKSQDLFLIYFNFFIDRAGAFVL